MGPPPVAIEPLLSPMRLWRAVLAMNRTARRAAAAEERKQSERDDLIKLAHAALAASDDPTVTGGTLILPTGEVVFISADDARALTGHGPARGRA